MTRSRSDEDSREWPGAYALGEVPDRDLAALARDGSRPAQAEILRRYMPIVYRISLKLSRDHDQASDLTQDVFVRAFQAMATFDPERSLRPWICTIAWNLARDALRKAKRRGERQMWRWGGGSGPGDERESLEPADEKSDSPFEQLERKERNEALDEALARLEPRARGLLILREVEGLSYEEIATISGASLGTVKSRMHRARLELKESLKAIRPDWFRSSR